MKNNSFTTIRTLLIVLMLLLNATLAAVAGDKLTHPRDYFGFNPGEDRKLFNYEALIGYLDVLRQESDMFEMIEHGQSPMGKPMYIAFVSSAENIARLEHLREINRRLAIDGDIHPDELRTLIDEGKVFVLVTLSMHSTEVAPSQAAPLMAYNLITGTDSNPKYLEDVVFMMVPCHNPDGMNMIVDHYNNYLGTEFEGSALPGIYHKYTGHNINRDFITLTQTDNQAVADIYNLIWYPQVLVEKHQMGSTGPRYFVPPNHDPIAQNIDELLWNWTWVFGSNMTRDMTAAGLSGISQHYLFDDYWPGSTQTSAWKNIISMLTEAASVQLATPIFIEANELNVFGKGLSEYKKSINFLAPWPGGWWRLEDLVDYELESVYSLVKTASLHRKEILEFRNELCRKEINKGLTQPPFYYILPAKQHDQSELIALLRLLERHGIQLYRLDQDIILEGIKHFEGDYIIPLAQPFRAFIKEVMEKQHYPVRRYTPGGEMIRPYDITSWSLPLHRGIKSIEVNKRTPGQQIAMSAISAADKRPEFSPTETGQFLVFSSNNNESFKAAFMSLQEGIQVLRNADPQQDQAGPIPAGSFIIRVTNRNKAALESILAQLDVAPLVYTHEPDVEAKALQLPRIALCETNFHDMDAGWTRFLFDTYNIPFTVLNPPDFKDKRLLSRFDVIVFPDNGKDQILQGRSTRGGEVFIPFYNPEYIEGMGSEGWQNVLEFMADGGRLVSWGRSTELFFGLMKPGNDQGDFRFPVQDISQRLQRDGFYCPGSLLKIKLLQDHPLTWGMPSEIGVFHRNAPVFATSVPNFGMNRRVIGLFPEEEPLLLSGYSEKEELLGRQPAIVHLQRGKGDAVLFSFVPNFRGSTQVSNKLIFNSLFAN
ncbi:MAG: M14 family zinc carboxypeptidase [Bacteroidales bacterium]|nr:M14 family zinc carboxypeptidase [Bacteroidales bacterium]